MQCEKQAIPAVLNQGLPLEDRASLKGRIFRSLRWLVSKVPGLRGLIERIYGILFRLVEGIE